MAMKISNATADSMLSSIATSLNSGFLRIYSGTEPATANAALSGNTLLAELTFAATAFTNPPAAGTGTNRQINTTTIVSDSSANADGTASFFRCFQTNGTSVVYQGTVTATSGGGQLELSSTSIVSTGVVSVSSLTIIQPTE